jgi:hypothetical protein
MARQGKSRETWRHAELGLLPEPVTLGTFGGRPPGGCLIVPRTVKGGTEAETPPC